ncbi:hypothetical protein GYMLUDRAFT_34343 [Collybiopsis luxurians FD-317 M1]|nr:hypothetical protein GYMLUDRAFT_34343 [Collybiopsis luxurians FD-317 M1]
MSNHYILKHAKPSPSVEQTLEDLDGIAQDSSVSHRTQDYFGSKKWLFPSISLTSGQTLSMTEDLYPSSSTSPGAPLPGPSKKYKQSIQDPHEIKEHDTIHKLLENPALYDPLRVPRNPIVLCHGLYGFDTRGPSSFPSLQVHYWSNVLNVLRDKIKAEVIVTAVPGTGSITTRAESLDRQLQGRASGRGLNFMAHSMGGLDCRHLISHVKPTKYAPLSLTTISTPHRGSPFMDWCSENLGLGKLAREEKELLSEFRRNVPSVESSTSKETRSTLSLSSLPSSFTTLLLSILDSPAYANLTSAHLNDVFNPATPDDPRVKYFSIAGRMSGVNIWHPLWLPKLVLDDFEQKERQRLRTAWEQEYGEFSEADAIYRPLWAREEEWGNDCLVTIQSAKWGEFLGVMEECDHWTIRGARGLDFGVEFPAISAINLGSSTGTGGGGVNVQDGWGLKDLGWFLRAWRKEEKVQQEAVARLPKSPGMRQKEREMKGENDDAVVKASTDKLSAVFDWVSERVPSPPYLSTKASSTASTSDSELTPAKTGPSKDPRKKSELESKKDLERFYIALSRKLYEEGL